MSREFGIYDAYFGWVDSEVARLVADQSLSGKRVLNPNPDPVECYPEMLRVMRKAYAPRPVVDGKSLDEFLGEVSREL